jgi:hypothetical protein
VTRNTMRDATDDKHRWGVEVPIYFMKSAQGGLAGGIVASYRGDTKRYDVSVFIGQAFDLHGDN